MIPYVSGAVLTVAAPGLHEVEYADGLFGDIRSRASAKLKYAENDIERLRATMPTYGAYVDSPLIEEKLINPTVDTFFQSVKRLVAALRDAQCESDRKKVFNLIYAGHGDPRYGALELLNGKISGAALHEVICESYGECTNRLHVDLVLDSCYSARFLIDFFVSAQGNSTVYPFDCIASSMPDEKSWEMDFLQHGAMSFHLTNAGNGHVDRNELAKAVDERNWAYVVRALQGVTVPNPVTFLTNGKQHAVELTSGHHFEVQGAGHFSVAEFDGPVSHIGLANALAIAKSAYGKEIEYNE